MSDDSGNPWGTETEYSLKCKVATVSRKSDAKTQETCFVLIPDLSTTEGMKFGSAWLPDTDKEHFELPMYLLSGLNYPCRGALFRSAPDLAVPHIFVMSTGVEDALKTKIGQTIVCQILPASQDDVCDAAPSTTRNL